MTRTLICNMLVIYEQWSFVHFIVHIISIVLQVTLKQFSYAVFLTSYPTSQLST